jgi:hypothetical protein
LTSFSRFSDIFNKFLKSLMASFLLTGRGT